MAAPTAADVDWLVESGRGWVRAQRERYRPLAVPLVEPVKAALGPFFTPAILDSTRCCLVPVIDNPPFRDAAIRRGVLTEALDFSLMNGLTFDDTFIVSAHPPAFVDLMFHELVHVVQYQILEVDEFIDQWVRGLLAGGGYFQIPLEVMAYELQARFEANPQTPFSVVDEVRRRLGR